MKHKIILSKDVITKEKIDYHSSLNNKKKLRYKNNNIKKSVYFILVSFTFLLSTFLVIPTINIAWSDSVIATVSVGNEPRYIAHNPDNGNMYVANTGADSRIVSVLDSNNQLIASVTVGLAPQHIAHNPDNGNMYVANTFSNTVSVIDSENNQVISTIPVGFSPRHIIHNPDNGNMYVVNSGSGTISIINSNNQIVSTLRVGFSPQHITYNPDNKNMYVTNFGSNTVSVINLNNQLITNIPVGTFPFHIAHNPDNGNMYVTNFGSNTVSVIDSENNQLITNVPVGLSPEHVAHNPDNGNMYVSNTFSNTVSVIDLNNQEIAAIPVGFSPKYIAHNPDNGNMYVANISSDTVSVIDSENNQVIENIPVGTPFYITYNPDNKNMYVTNFSSDSISIIQTTSIVDNVPPLTSITTVTDGNNNHLNSGDLTVSNSITFVFTGQDDITMEENLAFECIIDSATFEQCSSPLNLNNLNTGQHTFAVRAIDEAGNTDQTPYEFTWTVLTLSQGIEEIETIIEGMNLPQGTENSLKAQLSQSTKLLNDSNPNNDNAVCDKLGSFIEEVNQKLANSQLTAEQASLLVKKANAISDELGC